MIAFDEQLVASEEVDRSSLRSKFMMLKAKFGNSELVNVAATFATTLTIFGIYLGQGIIVARYLGAQGRGEFGTSIYFPRDILLYAGLLGGIEIVNSYASRGIFDSIRLKYSAARMGLFSGILTAIIAAVISIVALWSVGKSQLIPFCLLCCLFLPWEHMQLTVSAVDRGDKAYGRYNMNRLIFALSFPLLVLAAIQLNLAEAIGISPLLLVCVIFVLARVIGIVPTFRGMDLMGALKRFGRGETEPVNQKSVIVSDQQDADDALKMPRTWQLLREGKFYALSMVATEVFERLDIFLIVALASLTTSGHYFVAVPAAALLTVAPNALGVFTFNAGADHDRRNTLRECLTVMGATALLQIVATIVFALIVPYLIVFFYGASFSPAIQFAMWLLPACAIKGFLQAADGFLKGRGKPMIGVWARVLSIVLMLTTVWCLYPHFDLISIPMAACVGQALSMIIISVAVVRDVIENDRPSMAKGDL